MITAANLDHAATRTTAPDLADALARLAWHAYTAAPTTTAPGTDADVATMITADRDGDGEVIADADAVCVAWLNTDPADRDGAMPVIAPVALAVAITMRHAARDTMPTRATPDHLAPRLAADALAAATRAHNRARLAADAAPGTPLARDAEATADSADGLARLAARYAVGGDA